VKIKECIKIVFGFILITFCIFFFGLLLAPWFIYKILMTPIDYIRYKKSRYQKDFPHKYKWLSEPHIDNKAYTVVKENGFPVDYIKWSENYELGGYFVYKDILLDFSEPFFFDKKKELWLFWPREKEYEETDDDAIDEENTDDCLTVEDTRELYLGDFSRDVPDRECRRIVFFYRRDLAEKCYGKEGLEKLCELDDFIIYEKRTLADAIRTFIEGN
jgi:hypothetical protein